MKRGQSEIRVSPVGAVSNTLRSNLPSSPHRYRPRVPPSHCTSADLPPPPTSTSVPTLPSPPSWSSQHQSGPRTRRRPKQSAIAARGTTRGFPFSVQTRTRIEISLASQAIFHGRKWAGRSVNVVDILPKPLGLTDSSDVRFLS